VSNIDDPEMPALTLRMWIVGLSLCVFASGLNTFFNFRYPAPAISPLVLLLLGHPLGKLLAYTMPIQSITLRLPRWAALLARRISPATVLDEWRIRKREGKAAMESHRRKEEEELRGWEWQILLNPGPFNIKVRCVPLSADLLALFWLSVNWG
jgi:hypothetical protein